MNKKIAIALIALVGIGLYALPQTMALFAGQHSFYNIDPTGNQIPCEKCHGDVKAELDSNVNVATGTKAPHASMKCEFCHRLQIGQASGDGAFAMITYTGNATNTTGAIVKVSRNFVMKTADYEAQLVPNNVTYDPALELSTGRVMDKKPMSNPVAGRMYMPTGATAGGKFAPLFDNATYNYTGTVWTYSTVTTDVINSTTGLGVVANIPNGKIYPTYEDVLSTSSSGVVTNISFKDTLFTKDEAFDPTKVNFGTQSAVDKVPTVLLDGAGSRTVNTGSRYHAASLVACMDCHAGSSPSPGHATARLGMTNPDDETFCYRCHYGTKEPAELINGTNVSHLRTYELSAGGFGNGLTNNGPDTGEAEVHKQFTLNAPDTPTVGVFGGRIIPANNAACIACHTHVDTEITYNRQTTIQFTADSGTDGNWTVDGYVASVNSSIVNQGDNPTDPVIGTGGVSTG